MSMLVFVLGKGVAKRRTYPGLSQMPEQWRVWQRRVWNASPCRVENQDPHDRPGWAYSTLFLDARGCQADATKGDLTIQVTPKQLCKLAAMATDKTRFNSQNF